MKLFHLFVVLLFLPSILCIIKCGLDYELEYQDKDTNQIIKIKLPGMTYCFIIYLS